MKALFIGNSFTARNDLPGLLARLATSRKKRIATSLISAGGASLRRHWNDGQALQTMRNDHFDYVVLQEQSTLPIKNSKRMHENIRLFDEAIKAAGAKTVLYMTWARLHQWELQAAITDAYNIIGAELGAIVVPAGVAWAQFLASHKTPTLHDRDGSHPTPAGSYLAACVFLGVLCQTSPVGGTVDMPELSAGDQVKLQKAAAEALKLAH